MIFLSRCQVQTYLIFLSLLYIEGRAWRFSLWFPWIPVHFELSGHVLDLYSLPVKKVTNLLPLIMQTVPPLLSLTIQLFFSAVIQNIDLHLIYATILLSLCRSKLNINTLKYMAGLVIEMGTPEILLARSSIIERQYPGQYPLSIAPTTKPHTWPQGFFFVFLNSNFCSLLSYKAFIILNYPGFN